MKSLQTGKLIKIVFVGIFILAVVLFFIFFVSNGKPLMAIPIILFVLFFCTILFFIFKRNSKAVRVLRTGSDAHVIVVRIGDQELDTLIDGNKDFLWMLLEVKVEFMGMPTYEITRKLSFHRADLYLVKPGIVIPAKVSQENGYFELLWLEYKKSIGK